ncbi:Phosphopantetheine attachment site [Paenibacillus uliginis N3/975]|uniref:Phosphopantetheine attachment site n=1 Tax=Paenibacillus uliginis N3/975 TaxID=1313296 RepID=A0A1X7HG96_9BACL|nr:type I polyketide synthase [Paenibacillus uliginis]SMF85062.1 Phosphopantetheine attachment site [Paenibacillus uliginis N3/975]
MDFQSIKLNRKSIAELEDVAFDRTSSQDIAIVGIAVKLPLADTVEQFANNLKTGRDCVRPIPSLRKQDTDLYFKQMGLEPEDLAYGEAAYLDEIDKFDYSFFKLSPREASLLDPNQRLFLETAWRAIEDAGYGGGKLGGSPTGVYVGYGSDADYLKLIRQVEPEAVSMSMAGNVRPIIASRLSYLMDLRGPSFIVDSTCSSSLVAVHLACQAIRNGECDSAIVGGTQLHLIPIREYEVGIESSTSRARTFDDRADGTGTGEGVVAMMLKPLEQAIESRDHIYAVIKSSALNQDGGSVGITAPNAEAQEAVIADAWKRAGIDPETIGYIETHGTGTKLGDPIEVEGLKRAFRRFTDKRQFCAIGALKSNIGHLDNTAGIAGLLKAVLSLKNKCIYPTLHFDRPNRVIDFAESPVYVNDKLMEWKSGPHPRRCGVSSFGISGTNCHVILEEAPVERSWMKPQHDEYRLFVLSAQTVSALETYVDASLDYLMHRPSIDFGDLCYTLGTGRGHYRYRIAIAAKSVDEVVDELRSFKTAGFKGMQDRSQGESNSSLYADSIDRLQSQLEAIRSAAEVVFATYFSSDRMDRMLCAELGRLYVQGVSIPWERLYRQERRRRLSFPTYPFDRYRCWVNLTDHTSKGRARHTSAKRNDAYEAARNESHNQDQDQSAFYHQRRWLPEPLPQIGRKSHGCETILILTEDHQDSSPFVRRWKAVGSKVIEAAMGDSFKVVDVTKYIVRDEMEDYERLLHDAFDSFNSLGDRSLLIVDLRFAAFGNEDETLEKHEQQLEQSIYRLYRLIHALARRDGHESIAVTLVTSYADEVTAEQPRVRPEQFAMIGLSKAAGWENPNLKIRWIDVDEQSDLVESVCSELEVETTEYWTAYRQGKRYVECVDVLRLEEEVSSSLQPFFIRSQDINGTYLITGGLGSIGLLIVSHFVKESKGNIRLALMGRTALPPRDQWPDLEHADQDKKIVRAIRAIREMEDAGAQIEVIQADVSNKEQLSKAITSLRQRHGRIAGIVHAAGVSEGNLMSRLSAEELRSVIASKTTGTWLLDHLTRQDKPDFLVLYSSAITLVGGIGSGPYTAGNAYLDGYSAYRNRFGLRTLTINWPAWKETEKDEADEVDESKEMFCLMSQEDGIRAFQELLQASEAAPVRQAIVGRWNRGSHLFVLGELLPFRQSEQVQQALTRSITTDKTHAKADHRRSAGTANNGTFAAPNKWPTTHSEIEEAVAEAWKQVLGYEELDVHANFFEIGGDSILITRVHHYIDEEFPGLTTVADMFSYPTIARITDHLYDVVSDTEETGETTLESIEANSFNEAIFAMFERVKRGELSIENAVDLYRGMEVANG